LNARPLALVASSCRGSNHWATTTPDFQVYTVPLLFC